MPHRPCLALIVAMSENGVIGHHNRLPWHLPADLRHFKRLTIGKPVIMGRKTYESIGKPLPERTNIIITHDNHFQATSCVVVNSIEAALKAATLTNSEEIFIIGGAALYKQMLPLIQRIYLTMIHHIFAGDAYFPELNSTEWEEKERITHEKDTANPYSYSFVVLERIKHPGVTS